MSLNDDMICPTLQKEVHDRLEKQKLGMVTQAHVDQLIVPCILMYNNDAITQRLSWQELTPSLQDTFQAVHLCDIGSYVRSLLTNSMESSDEFNSMMHLSMPYIKHNRLSLFSFERADTTVLQNILRLQLATCLGLYNENSKKPLWKVRVKLVAMFINILATGTPRDMYIFCSSHVSLTRLALIEYYVFFVEKYMPVEYGLQHIFFGKETAYSTTTRQIKCIMDSFRQSQFQVDMQWHLVNGRAQTAVEKCNRCAKGLNYSTPPPQITKFTVDAIAQAKDEIVVPIVHSLKHETITYRQIHRMVRTYSLPLNVITRQTRQIRDKMRQDTIQATNMCFMYACMACTSRIPDKGLRYGSDGDIVCGNCLTSKCILRINMIGKLIRVADHYYYLCPVCLNVHLWESTGHEFSSCHKRPEKTVTGRSCMICTSKVSINKIMVLDSRIGCMQQVTLCNRHTPYEHSQRYVHDIDSLIFQIQTKFKRLPVCCA